MDGCAAVGRIALDRIDVYVRRPQPPQPRMADQNRILLTTAPGVDGFRVARTLDVITGGRMFEQRLFGDVLANQCLQDGEAQGWDSLSRSS
jgi:hypothetical protein